VAVYALRRLLGMALVMLAVSLLVFVMIEATPGTVATQVLGPYASEEQRQLWLAAHGYLEPAWLRYLHWLGRFAAGDLGVSIRYRVPVADVLLPRLGNTALLAFWTLVVLVPLSLVLGVLAGVRAGSPLDGLLSIACVIGTSVPEFASAVLLSAVFVFELRLLPGTSTMTDGFAWRQLVLPVAVLVIYDLGYLVRMTRVSVAEVIAAPYIRAARLRGFSWPRIVLRHALRNALVTPVQVLALQISWLLSGVVVVEVFFAYKGFGSLLWEAALNRDIFVVEACAMVAVVVTVAMQAAADLAHAALDPRVRSLRRVSG
jgi:peptide/nickel transport system permease protein